MFLVLLPLKVLFLMVVCINMQIRIIYKDIYIMFVIDLAIVTALMSIGGTISTSVGGTIAGAIWNSLLPGQLASHVPGEFDASQILGNITYIQALSPEQRNGSSIAYGEVQRILSIVALCLSVLALAFWFRMKSFGLTEHDHHDAQPEISEKESSPNEQVADDYSIAKTNSKT